MNCDVELLFNIITPCSVNVVSFSIKLNGALKAISDISFISDKTRSTG